MPNFGGLADASLLADLAARSETAGWDGWFLMDHVVHRGGDEPAVDPAQEWAEAGATWWLQQVPPDRPVSDLEALIDAGPPRASG